MNVQRFVRSALALGLLPMALVFAAAPAFAGANVVIVPFDAPGTGYFDPTPATPVGGNPGTTLGDQRLIAAQFAATLWGATLTSDQPIFVGVRFTPLTCSPTSGVLGSAGTTFVLRDFDPSVFPSTWYHSALADAISGVDQVPGFVDISSNFNSSVDDDPNCLGGRGWYYGLDHNQGTAIDFLAVLAHELAHGLGHSNFVNEATGANFSGFTDVYSVYTVDNTTGLHWNTMTDAERAASAVNCRNVAWDGPAATATALNYLAPGTPLLTVNSPGSIAGDYPVGAAGFGPALSTPGLTGDVVLADDGVLVGSDACEPLVNGGAIAGNIALVDRGGCPFVTKTLNAEAAGATAVIVADNVAGCPPPGLGGTDPTITIPSVRVTNADGAAIKAELGGGVNVTLGVDPTRLAGADAAGHPLLYAVDPVALGSSISHWDTSTFPNTLMEPSINADLIPAFDLDLSPGQMADVGWTLMTTTMLDGCDTGIGLVPLLAGQIEVCRLNAGNHGQFVSCVAQLGNSLKAQGLITGAQKGQLTSCAAGSSLP